MTTIKLFDGDLGDLTAYFRCDLSQASSRLQHWDEEEKCWVSTQYQCADCAHSTSNMVAICESLADGLVEMNESEFSCEWTEVSGFVEDADLDHEDARDWYLAYGWCLSTDSAGDVCHSAVEYDWLDDDDDEAVAEKLMAADANLTEDEAEAIVAKAREILKAGEEIKSQLVAAVEAYEANDYAACVEALRLAGELESPHGDTPASDSLRDQLIDDSLIELMAAR